MPKYHTVLWMFWDYHRLAGIFFTFLLLTSAFSKVALLPVGGCQSVWFGVAILKKKVQILRRFFWFFVASQALFLYFCRRTCDDMG